MASRRREGVASRKIGGVAMGRRWEERGSGHGRRWGVAMERRGGPAMRRMQPYFITHMTWFPLLCERHVSRRVCLGGGTIQDLGGSRLCPWALVKWEGLLWLKVGGSLIW